MYEKNKLLFSSLIFTSISIPMATTYLSTTIHDNKIINSDFKVSRVNDKVVKNNIELTIPNNGSNNIHKFSLSFKNIFADINSLKDLSKNKNYFNEVDNLIEFDLTSIQENDKVTIKNYTLNLISILFQGYFNENLKNVSLYNSTGQLDTTNKTIKFFENNNSNVTQKDLTSTLSNGNNNSIKLTLNDSTANNNIVFEFKSNDKNKKNIEIEFINQLNKSIKLINVASLFNFSLDNLDLTKNYYTYSYDMFNGTNTNNQLIKVLMFAINKPKIDDKNSTNLNNLIQNIESIDINLKEKNPSNTPAKEYSRNIKFSNDEKIDYSHLDLPFDKDMLVTNIKINTKQNSLNSSFLNMSKDIQINLQTEKNKLDKIELSKSITVNIEELYKKIDKTKSLSENLKLIEQEIKNNPLSIKFFEFDDLNSLNNKTNKKKYEDWYKLVITNAFDSQSDWYKINLSYIYVDKENTKGYVRLIIKSNDGKELINTFIKEKNDNNAPNSGGSSSSNGNSTSGNNSSSNGNQNNIYESSTNSSFEKWVIYVGIEILLVILIVVIIFVLINKNKQKKKI